MAVSRAVSSSVSSPNHSSDELSDHYDTDIDSDDDILDINTSHLRHGPQHHPMSPQIPARQSSRQAQETRYYNDKKTDFEGDRSLAHDSIYFDEYWKEFGRRRQQGQRYPAKPRYSYPQHQPHLSDGKMNARFPGGSAGHDAFAYHDSRQRRPLISYVNNGWQSSSSNSGTSDIDHGTPSAGQILAAPMIRRILYAVSAFLLILWYWGSWSKPSRDENRAIETAIAGRKSGNGQYFGSNLRPDFIGMKHMDVLDEDLIPGNGRIERLVAVGDAHGCHEELTALLTQISFTPSTDHLIFTGDMISKGPSSPAVIDLAIQYNASCVRGNHEDRVLLSHRDLSTHTLTSFKRSSQRKSNIKKDTSEDLTGPSETDDYIDEPVASVLPAHGDPSTTSHELDTEHFPTGRALDRDLASVLTPPQLRYLKSCPVLLHLGSLPPLGPTTVVHAGLVPGVSLQQQDPMGAMHMRTLDLATYVPSPDSNGGATWSRVWEKYQNQLPAKERSTVIYGHDSKKGLQVKNKWSKGLDSGCVKGGKLSALVYTRRKEGESGKVEIVSVGCKDYRPKRGGDVVELGQS